MAKIKYDVRGVESGGEFKTPPPDMYRATIEEVNQKESKAGNQMLEVILEISRGDFKGSRLWDYIVLNEASAWKLRQLLEAVGLVKGKKERGTLDTAKIVGSEVQVRVRNETSDEFGTRARVGAILAMPEDEDEEDLDDDDEDEDLDEDDDDDEDEDEDDDEDDEDDEDEDDEDEEDYADWTVSDLRAELKERGLKTSGSKKLLVKRLEKDDETDDDGEPF